MLHGEEGNNVAATVQDSQNYKTKHTYPAGLTVANDPQWTMSSPYIAYPSSLPSFMVLGPDMTLLHGSSSTIAVTALLESLASGEGGTLPAGLSCAGTCGSDEPTAGQCYCDEACWDYNDCCPDNCEACNNCSPYIDE